MMKHIGFALLFLMFAGCASASSAGHAETWALNPQLVTQVQAVQLAKGPNVDPRYVAGVKAGRFLGLNALTNAVASQREVRITQVLSISVTKHSDTGRTALMVKLQEARGSIFSVLVDATSGLIYQ